MSTLAELKSTIADDLNRSDLTSQIANEVTRAIEFYGKEKFWFLEGTQDMTLSASQTWYTMPSNFFAMDDITITLNGSKTPLDRVDYSELNDEDSGRTFGQPSEWTFYKDNLRFYPIPDSAYVIGLSYHLILNPPSDSGSNAWTTHAFDLIRNRAEKILYRNVIKDINGVELASSGEQDELSRLISSTIKKVSSGKLKKSGF